MPYECPECGSEKTLTGGYFETCAECGYCSVDRLTQVKALLRKIDKLTERNAKVEQQLYDWASIINRMAVIAMAEEVSSNDRDDAQDAIDMVIPYLGLAEE